MIKTSLSVEEDRDMCKRLFEDCNKKQDEEIERLRREQKERSERLALTTAVERTILVWDVPRGQCPLELLTPRELSQKTEVQIPTVAGRVTIPDPSDTLGDPVVERTLQKLVEAAGRLLANRKVPGSGVTAPYERLTIQAEWSSLWMEVMKRAGAVALTKPTETSRVSDKNIRDLPMKKVSRVFDKQKNSRIKNTFTGVPDTDMRACFNRLTWVPTMNMQQPPLGTSHLILGDSLVRVLQKLRTSWITTVMAFGGATIVQIYRMVELMNPGRIPDIMILIGTKNVSRRSYEEEAQWDSMMVCLFTAIWQKFQCAVLTVCTIPMSKRMLSATGRSHNERVIRWNNIVRYLASRNAGRMILMDLEHELRAMDQARFKSDGIHFDSIEGQAWMSRVFQGQLDELEFELFDTGVLRREETTNEPALSTFVPPNPETHLGSVPAIPQVEYGRIRPNGRSASKEEHSSATEIRTCQLNSGHDLGHLEIGNDEYEQRGTTSRQKFSDVVETHILPLACL